MIKSTSTWAGLSALCSTPRSRRNTALLTAPPVGGAQWHGAGPKAPRLNQVLLFIAAALTVREHDSCGPLGQRQSERNLP